MKIFISYTRKDSDKSSTTFGRSLARFLISHELDIVFDELSFNPGNSISEEIKKNIETSNKFIFLASEDSLNSDYVLEELDLAQKRAKQLLPSPYFHIVCLSENIKLPTFLEKTLHHEAFNKSEMYLFYEIFLSLHDITIGELISSMLKYNPDSRWIILGRYQKIELLNEDGDVRMITKRTILNATSKKQLYNSRMNIWGIGATDFKELKFKMFDEERNEISYELIKENHRGKDTLKYKIGSDQILSPNDLFTFTTEYECKNGFDLHTGDEHDFPTEDMVYGYYRLDLSFPRDSKPEMPIVKITESDKQEEVNLINQGCNNFMYSRINIKAGIGFKFLFKIK